MAWALPGWVRRFLDRIVAFAAPMSGRRRLLLSRFVEWSALAAIPVFSAVKAAGAPETIEHGWDLLRRDITEWYVTCVTVSSVLGVMGKLGQSWFGGESKIRLKAVLSAIDEACFQAVAPEERYLHRVTLFKANFSHTKLSAYCRAGDRYQHRISSFTINHNDERSNEGIIGQAWFRNATTAKVLPPCPGEWSDDDPDCREYARQGLLPVKKAAKLNVKSRSVLAMPIRNLKGNKWGVLVLDSRQPDAFDTSRTSLVQSIALALGQMV